ncbi:hypothetical protein Ahia01_001269700 [Argonauta hians]
MENNYAETVKTASNNKPNNKTICQNNQVINMIKTKMNDTDIQIDGSDQVHTAIKFIKNNQNSNAESLDNGQDGTNKISIENNLAGNIVNKMDNKQAGNEKSIDSGQAGTGKYRDNEADNAIKVIQNGQAGNVIKTKENKQVIINIKPIQEDKEHHNKSNVNTGVNNQSEEKYGKNNVMKRKSIDETSDVGKGLSSINMPGSKNHENKNLVSAESKEAIVNSNEPINVLLQDDDDEEEDAEDKSKLKDRTALFQTYIPYFPIEIASLCFVCNVLMPGLGSVLCGILQVCYGESQKSKKKMDKSSRILMNISIGVMQFSTFTFFLVGWFWSIAWGLKILFISIDKQKLMKKQQQKEKMKSELVTTAYRPGS